jgi:hypothetical protein
MELLESTIYLLVAIDKNGFYSELVEKIKTDKKLGNSIASISDKVNRNSSNFNKEYIDSLRDEEIVALIRVLTKLDGELSKLTLGSVSSVPYLIETLQERNYNEYESVVDWVFKNKTNDYLPFGSLYLSHSKSLKDYRLNIEEDRLKKEQIKLEAEIRRVEKQKEYYPKATQDLRNAIRRKDWMAFDALVRKGAEIYTLDDDGKTLAEKMSDVKRAEIKKNSISKLRIENNLYLTDSTNQALTITVSDITPSDDDLDIFDCVSMTARYDNGFGFSQLYRFVDDKESQEVKDCCDLVIAENKSKLLPIMSSGRWWIVVTPIVKGDGYKQRESCKSIMKDIFELSQQSQVSATKLFISQFRYMFDYREEQLSGVFEALQELRDSSFGSLNSIYFEVDTRFRDRFAQQVRSCFIK